MKPYSRTSFKTLQNGIFGPNNKFKINWDVLGVGYGVRCVHACRYYSSLVVTAEYVEQKQYLLNRIRGVFVEPLVEAQVVVH